MPASSSATSVSVTALFNGAPAIAGLKRLRAAAQSMGGHVGRATEGFKKLGSNIDRMASDAERAKRNIKRIQKISHSTKKPPWAKKDYTQDVINQTKALHQHAEALERSRRAVKKWSSNKDVFQHTRLTELKMPKYAKQHELDAQNLYKRISKMPKAMEAYSSRIGGIPKEVQGIHFPDRGALAPGPKKGQLERVLQSYRDRMNLPTNAAVNKMWAGKKLPTPPAMNIGKIAESFRMPQISAEAASQIMTSRIPATRGLYRHSPFTQLSGMRTSLFKAPELSMPELPKAVDIPFSPRKIGTYSQEVERLNESFNKTADRLKNLRGRFRGFNKSVEPDSLDGLYSRMDSLKMRAKTFGNSFKENFRAAQGETENLKHKLGGVADKFRDFPRFESSIGIVEMGARNAAYAVQDLGDAITGLGIKLSILSAILGVIGYISAKSAYEWRREWNAAKAVTAGTHEEMEELAVLVSQLGRTTKFTSIEIAGAVKYLGLAGNTASEQMNMLAGTVHLAAASGLDLGRSADIVTNILQGFGLSVEDTSYLADMLTNTFINSNVNLSMLAETMKRLGPVSAALGFSVAEVLAVVGALGNAGIQGEIAGTHLKTGLQHVAKGAHSAGRALKRLNMKAEDVDMGQIGLIQTLRNINDALSKVQSRTERYSIVADLFGKRAAPTFLAALASIDTDAAELNETLLYSEGRTKAVSDTMLDGIIAFEAFRAAFVELKIEIGEVILEALEPWINKGRELIDQFLQLSYGAKVLYIGLGAIGVAAGPAVLITGILIKQLGGLMLALVNLAFAFNWILSPMGLLIAGFVAFGIAIYQFASNNADAAEMIKLDVDSLKSHIEGGLNSLIGFVAALGRGDWSTAWLYLGDLVAHGAEVIVQLLVAMANVLLIKTKDMLDGIVAKWSGWLVKMDEVWKWLQDTTAGRMVTFALLVFTPFRDVAKYMFNIMGWATKEVIKVFVNYFLPLLGTTLKTVAKAFFKAFIFIALEVISIMGKMAKGIIIRLVALFNVMKSKMLLRFAEQILLWQIYMLKLRTVVSRGMTRVAAMALAPFKAMKGLMMAAMAAIQVVFVAAMNTLAAATTSGWTLIGGAFTGGIKHIKSILSLAGAALLNPWTWVLGAIASASAALLITLRGADKEQSEFEFLTPERERTAERLSGEKAPLPDELAGSGYQTRRDLISARTTSWKSPSDIYKEASEHWGNLLFQREEADLGIYGDARVTGEQSIIRTAGTMFLNDLISRGFMDPTGEWTRDFDIEAESAAYLARVGDELREEGKTLEEQRRENEEQNSNAEFMAAVIGLGGAVNAIEDLAISYDESLADAQALIDMHIPEGTIGGDIASAIAEENEGDPLFEGADINFDDAAEGAQVLQEGIDDLADSMANLNDQQITFDGEVMSIGDALGQAPEDGEGGITGAFNAAVEYVTGLIDMAFNDPDALASKLGGDLGALTVTISSHVAPKLGEFALAFAEKTLEDALPAIAAVAKALSWELEELGTIDYTPGEVYDYITKFFETLTKPDDPTLAQSGLVDPGNLSEEEQEQMGEYDTPEFRQLQVIEMLNTGLESFIRWAQARAEEIETDIEAQEYAKELQEGADIFNSLLLEGLTDIESAGPAGKDLKAGNVLQLGDGLDDDDDDPGAGAGSGGPSGLSGGISNITIKHELYLRGQALEDFVIDTVITKDKIRGFIVEQARQEIAGAAG